MKIIITILLILGTANISITKNNGKTDSYSFGFLNIITLILLYVYVF